MLSEADCPGPADRSTHAVWQSRRPTATQRSRRPPLLAQEVLDDVGRDNEVVASSRLLHSRDSLDRLSDDQIIVSRPLEIAEVRCMTPRVCRRQPLPRASGCHGRSRSHVRGIPSCPHQRRRPGRAPGAAIRRTQPPGPSCRESQLASSLSWSSRRRLTSVGRLISPGHLIGGADPSEAGGPLSPSAPESSCQVVVGDDVSD